MPLRKLYDHAIDFIKGAKLFKLVKYKKAKLQAR